MKYVLQPTFRHFIAIAFLWTNPTCGQSKAIVAQQAMETTYFATLTRISIDFERIDSKTAGHSAWEILSEGGARGSNATLQEFHEAGTRCGSAVGEI